jgi:DNA-binding NarL/FixJ family response regulator
VRATEPPAIAVTSERSLVAEAVGAALSGSNLDVVQISWPGDRRDPDAGWPPGTAPPEQGLMLCDLAPSTVAAARWVVSRYPARWLLLTDAPRGPMWGAMLEVGVVKILRSSTTMADLLDVIDALRAGTVGEDRSDRDELVAMWREDQAERAAARARVNSLTRRELEVLQLLHLGLTVGQISERNEVAPSTVRSQVRSVLRKLGVNSQLAAAAHFEKWGGDGP